MKARYRKGLANHPDPDSCGGAREGVVEALTGESAGQPLSREITQSGAPTLLSEAEGHTDEGATREPSKGPARSQTDDRQTICRKKFELKLFFLVVLRCWICLELGHVPVEAIDRVAHGVDQA